jgi:serpin B
MRRTDGLYGMLLLAAMMTVCWIAAACWTTERAVAQDAGEMEELVTGNNAFALDLYGQLRGGDGNLFFSPFSISTALAMTYGGARGETGAQMARVLRYGLDSKRLHPAFKTLMDGLNAGKAKRGYELSIANALWGQKGYGFLKAFLDLTRTHYGAGLREVDFIGGTEAARKTINDWVEEETRGKIVELIQPGVLDSLCRLVLTNAIYFKGNWASRFKVERTKKAPFTLLTGRKVDVPTMHQTADFKYLQGEGFQALELPYVGKALSMVIFLPGEPNGLPDFEKSLTTKNLDGRLAKLRKRKVRVFLPKFKVTHRIRLARVLRSMGMRKAFSDDADFSGMNGKMDLRISAVVHKAFVEVNEEGTEAAAATAVVMKRKGIARPRPIPVFRADHPFLFLIRDTTSKSILFLGRVIQPGG